MSQFIHAQIQTGAGAVFAALLLLALAGLVISLLKRRQFRKNGVGQEDRAEEARPDAKSRPAPFKQRVVLAAQAGLASGGAGPLGRQRARLLAEETAIEGLTRFSRHLPILDAIVYSAPVLGILGTIYALIKTIETTPETLGGVTDPTQLTTGILTAFATTIAGVAVAVPFFFVSARLEAALEREAKTLEELIAATVPDGVSGDRGQGHEADGAPAIETGTAVLRRQHKPPLRQVRRQQS
ncbi:MotA/TolQ/ExbB proton channel family protein [Jiella sp. MQZ9-1]|uniref:MotA/TolQ/ExbB proton channel family protein n=1 Tax=Jiella flava TaxID=2816857 RepID=A0A939G1L7_9HYPH|nr:MotA/TolQ/ExbB proton channel family protein [Jiella flava]MBO0664136.1 MotA/TolQ/ExbB proton channel family protein [Jiella flava]MCD2472708.1 MotA/TolQ/ExbB proton channel family protein [Jiella flava]